MQKNMRVSAHVIGFQMNGIVAIKAVVNSLHDD